MVCFIVYKLYLAAMFSGLLNFINQHTPVTPEDFQTLVSTLVMNRYDKKTRLIEIGQVENNMHFVAKGLIRRFFYRGNEEVITQIIKEGGLAGSAASFLSRQPSKYVVETLEPSQVFSISFDRLELLYAKGNKWEKFGRLITTHFLLQQELLLMDNIRLTVKEGFKKFMRENPDLLQRVPQKQLASYLNIKQETFSRMKHLMYDKSLKTA